MVLGVLIFLVIGVAFAISRGDGIGAVAAFTAAVAVGGGLVIAGYVWSRRERN
jgi:hypothetical protein